MSGQDKYIQDRNPNTPPAFELGRVREWFEARLQSEGLHIGMFSLDHNNMDGYLHPEIQRRWVDFKTGYDLANEEAQTAIRSTSAKIPKPVDNPVSRAAVRYARMMLCRACRRIKGLNP